MRRSQIRSGGNHNFEFQRLEPKCLLAGISFDAGTGVITVDGSSNRDRVLILNESATEIRVDFDGVADQTFNRAQISEIVFYGGSGDDRFRNETNIGVQAFGQLGDDLLIGGSGNDVLHGGLGEDRLGGKDGNDILDGGDQADLLFGGQGNDILNGSFGNDRLVGQRGDDTINGGSGDDFVNGSGGSDEINGGDGNDYLRGGAGADQIGGSNGDDTILGNKGHDVLSGNAGRDAIFGGQANDLIYGGSESDDLYGNRGLDEIFGGSGNDDLYGGRDADQLRGNDGNDDYYTDDLDEVFEDSSDSSVDGDFEIRGEINDLDTGNQNFSVLGINVSYSNAEFVTSLETGKFVKVEGSYNGTILNANEVENKLDDDRFENFEARGVVNNLNTASQTFTFFGFTVNYSTARVEGQISNGQQIVVEGRLAGNNVVAERIQSGGNDDNNGDDTDNNTNRNFELRGEISNFNSANQTFNLLGLTVNFSNAQLQGSFGNGSFVKVDGFYDGQRIDAREVEVEIDDDRDENVEAVGVIENLNTNSQTFQLLGFTVRYAGSDIETSLANGNTVEVEGRFENGIIFADDVR